MWPTNVLYIRSQSYINKRVTIAKQAPPSLIFANNYGLPTLIILLSANM